MDKMKPAGPENNWYYNPKLRPLAKALRGNMTKAEASLWKYVLRSRKTGYSFTRQRPVLSFIVDFMCKELNLVIEVDGITHLEKEVIEKDEIKQQKLEEAGFHVLRFTDELVLNRIDIVAQEIEEYIRIISKG